MVDKDVFEINADPSGWTREAARTMFQALLGDFPDGAAVFDDDEQIVVANRAFCEIVGYELDELQTMRIGDVSAEGEARTSERLAGFFSVGSQRANIAVRTRSGEQRMVNYVAHRDVLPGRHITFVRNITEEMHRQQEVTVKAGVLDSLEAAVYVVDTGGLIALWNKAAEEITGYPASEVIGARVESLELAPAAEIDMIRRRVLAAMQTKGEPGTTPKPLEISGLRRRKDGSIFPSWSHVTALRDEHGSPVGTLVMLHDVSAERERDAARAGEGDVGQLLVSVGREATAGRSPADLLEFAVERLAATLGVEFVASWRLDARTGTIELEAGRGWGQAWPSLALGSGEGRRALVDSPLIIDEADSWERGSVFDRAGIHSGMVAPILGHGRSDGALAVYSRERRRFSPGELESLAAVAELISAARARVRLARVEGHLEVARRQASLGALITGVAHDFNNMLSVIIGYARLMEREIGHSELLAEGIAEISVAAGRAKHLSRGLVDLGRPSRTEPEVLDVGAIVTEVGELLHRTLGDTVELRIDPGPAGATVLMCQGELDRVLVNLVANARDALPDGGRVEIRVRLCLLYTSPSPRDGLLSRMPSSA